MSPGGRYLFGRRWIPLDPFHLDGGNSFLSEWTLMLDLEFCSTLALLTGSQVESMNAFYVIMLAYHVSFRGCFGCMRQAAEYSSLTMQGVFLHVMRSLG